MSERIQVKRDGEHRGWVSYVGVNIRTRPDDGRFNPVDLICEDVWQATRQRIVPGTPMTERIGDNLYETPNPRLASCQNLGQQTFPSRDAAIRWLVEEETA